MRADCPIEDGQQVCDRDECAGVARRCVLLVEDDAPLLRVLARLLEFDGFAVLVARDARSAAEQAREHGEQIEVIVTDVLLPDRTGRELADDLARACPTAPIVFMSGSPAHGSELPPLPVPTRFLPKPFSPGELKEALHALAVI